jgi:hypothetical protein
MMAVCGFLFIFAEKNQTGNVPSQRKNITIRSYSCRFATDRLLLLSSISTAIDAGREGQLGTYHGGCRHD